MYCRYMLPGSNPGIYEIRLKLPTGLSCTQCVLQWRYHTGMLLYYNSILNNTIHITQECYYNTSQYLIMLYISHRYVIIIHPNT